MIEILGFERERLKIESVLNEELAGVKGFSF